MSAIINNDKIILSNPISRQEIAEIDITSIEEIQDIINQASIYHEWSSLSIKNRCKYINLFRKELLKNKDEIKKIIINETGKKDFDAFIEIFTTLEHLK